VGLLRILILAAAALTAAACGGGSPYCGDGDLNEGEECDDGNDDDTDFCLASCKARQLSSLTLKWEFNSDEELGFLGDACIDMRARRVQVELLGGPEPLMMDESCSFKQVVFVDIPAGTYTARLAILDKDDLPLTETDPGQEIVFPGGSTTEVMQIAPEKWLQSYLGTFFFRVGWMGADCDTAVPAVVQQNLTLVAGGQVFTGSTTDGAALDGSLGFACQLLTEEFPQAALDVPFGAATFTIEGLDAGGATVYESEFETFVGAGVNNPELVFDVDLSVP
jgi:cysteine-rich repeat protein